MISRPEILKIDEVLYIVQVTRVEGEITAVDGPYVFKSESGANRKEFINALNDLVTRASHEPILSLKDLPEALQEQIKSHSEAGNI